MKDLLKKEIDFLCEDLFLERKNHVLLYGKHEDTFAVLQGIYERAKKDKTFLCSWHDASKIINPMDFFEPILRLKYEKGYEVLKEKDWFKELIEKNTMDGIFKLTEFCGKEKNSKFQNARKLPIFFIDGIEDLFFKFDYSHLDEEGRKKLLSINFLEQPLPKGFGNHLRNLHQSGKGIFYGLVKNTESLEFKSTLGNYNYLFYNENFRNHDVWRED